MIMIMVIIFSKILQGNCKKCSKMQTDNYNYVKHVFDFNRQIQNTICFVLVNIHSSRGKVLVGT